MRTQQLATLVQASAVTMDPNLVFPPTEKEARACTVELAENVRLLELYSMYPFGLIVRILVSCSALMTSRSLQGRSHSLETRSSLPQRKSNLPSTRTKANKPAFICKDRIDAGSRHVADEAFQVSFSLKNISFEFLGQRIHIFRGSSFQWSRVTC